MTLSTFIACPGCKHTLTLPADFVGKRVQCPQCLIDFEAYPTITPALEVDPPRQPAEAETPVNTKPATNGEKPPPLDADLQTAYASSRRRRERLTSSSADASIYCMECGVKYSRAEDECPACGCPIEGYADEPVRQPRRRPRRRSLQPVREWLSLVAVILIPTGAALTTAIIFVSSEILRLRGRNFDLVVFLALGVGAVIELAALVCIFIWLFQAWRIVLHDDEEYSPGLMVGMLFVPVFNLYWMFRAIPGLSEALQEELRYMAPHRTHSAGRTPGLIACFLMLIPYFQPFAVCMFLAWMLLANNALRRLVRFHEEWLAEARRESADQEGAPSRAGDRVEPRDV